MNKNFLQDVVPPNAQKRSIRDIPLPTGRNKILKEQDININRTEIEKKEDSFIPPTRPPENTPRQFEDDSHNYQDNNHRKNEKVKNKKIFWSVCLLLLVIIIFVSFNFFSGAEVTITPKQAEAVINENIEAISSEEAGDSKLLVYKLIEIKEEATTTVKATGEENIETKASGIITISNNHTTSSQPLVKNTRFETPEGLIYRIDKSVTVPGKSESGQAGTIDVEVFADEVGEKYNLESSSFTIPGFSGTPQFDGFSAKTKTAMSGGFQGVRPVISADDFQATLTTLQNQLQEQLTKRAELESAGETIALYDKSVIRFSTPKQESNSNREVVVSITGSLDLFAFDNLKFSNYLASEVLTIFNQDDEVYIFDPSTLEIKLVVDSLEENNEDKKVSVDVSGKARFVWKNDNELLKQTLLGTEKKELKNILQDFNGIAKAEAVIRPFWKSKFPEKLEKITIIEKLSSDE